MRVIRRSGIMFVKIGARWTCEISRGLALSRRNCLYRSYVGSCSHRPMARPRPGRPFHIRETADSAVATTARLVVLFNAVCPDSVFGCPELWEHWPAEMGQIDLLRSTENAYGKERRTWLPSYRSTIRRDPR